MWNFRLRDCCALFPPQVRLILVMPSVVKYWGVVR